MFFFWVNYKIQKPKYKIEPWFDKLNSGIDKRFLESSILRSKDSSLWSVANIE